MTYKYIAIEQQRSVLKIILNRPELHNAFNDDMIAELARAFSDAGQDTSVRVVILAASGKSFCAGADLNWMKRMVSYTFEENKADAMALAQMLKAICECPKPVIARVQGNAFGGGVGLIAACDFAVSTENAGFALTEVKLGLIPAVISPFVLRKMPATDAHRYFLTAERFGAIEAQHYGLIQEALLDEVALDEWIDVRVEALLANGPEAVANAKRLIHEVLLNDWQRVLDVTTTMIAERRASAEGQEGMRAFLEKRPPGWLNTPHPPSGHLLPQGEKGN